MVWIWVFIGQGLGLGLGLDRTGILERKMPGTNTIQMESVWGAEQKWRDHSFDGLLVGLLASHLSGVGIWDGDERDDFLQGGVDNLGGCSLEQALLVGGLHM